MPAAYGAGLPPPIIGNIQQRFEGRVIGVRPNGGPCRNVEREIIINGSPVVARDFACQQPDGTWSTEFNYDVQVLTRRGNVVIVTVDPVSGRVLGVRQ